MHFDVNQNYPGCIFGQAETLCAYETLKLEDYDKMIFDYFERRFYGVGYNSNL